MTDGTSDSLTSLVATYNDSDPRGTPQARTRGAPQQPDGRVEELEIMVITP